MRWVGATSSVLGVTVILALSCAIVGSFAAPRSTPSLNDDDQLAPSQMQQPMAAAVSEPPSLSAPSTSHPVQHATAQPPAPARKPMSPSASRTEIACSGPFAQDSGMLELAMIFGSGNMIFTHENVQGSEVGVTVLYPKDPRRRLEVWWSNPNRTGLYLIDIAGKSVWTGPDGLRLGLTLPELEKLNRKPFKLKGFDKDGIATATDWAGGTLAAFPGGCKVSVSLHADAKASKDAIGAISADQEFSSADSVFHAVKPTVSEILIGY
jgi:hypothetical protein